MARARTGWIKAGEPFPRLDGIELDLIRLLPRQTLLAIPWGMKSPHDLAWQSVPFESMSDFDYYRRLGWGNIGLLCGLDRNAVAARLIDEAATIGLDPDNERLAKLLVQCDPWLENTFTVAGARSPKRFFEVVGPGLERCLQSTKIIRESDEAEVGDWLGQARQGVIAGLHPSGIFYRHNNKPLLRIRASDFVLPSGYRLRNAEGDSANTVTRRLKASIRSDQDELPGVSQEQVAQAVEALEGHYAEDYGMWLEIGFGLHWWGEQVRLEAEARRLFHVFSKKCPRKYDRGQTDSKWDSFGRTRPGRRITIATLFYYAAKSGFTFDQENDDEYGD